MKYCTVINCMDGRVQRPVLEHLMDRFDVPYVDTITAPGPNSILSRQEDGNAVQSILKCLEVSVHKHDTVSIAVVGHYDCAGNPGDRDHQNDDTRGAVRFLRDTYPDTPIIGLYVNETGSVEEIDISAG
ncbi:carbonic anhydrase [Candidatus Bipolaricaulota bacterium]